MKTYNLEKETEEKKNLGKLKDRFHHRFFPHKNSLQFCELKPSEKNSFSINSHDNFLSK